jgi:hypothetical protein
MVIHGLVIMVTNDPDHFVQAKETINLFFGEHFHFVWGPGRSDAETSTKTEVQEAYKARGEEYGAFGSSWYYGCS